MLITLGDTKAKQDQFGFDDDEFCGAYKGSALVFVSLPDSLFERFGFEKYLARQACVIVLRNSQKAATNEGERCIETGNKLSMFALICNTFSQKM